MRTKDWPDMSRTEAALKLYDEEDLRLEAYLRQDDIDNDGVNAGFARREAYRQNVGFAYWQDTADRNSRSTCVECVNAEDAREAVRNWNKQP